jgi:uncharacterized membrane protein (UPF0127 family)
MIKQLLLPLAAVAAFIVLVGIFTQKQSSINLSKYIPVATPTPAQTVTIGNKTIQVEIAKTETERAKGLSGRSSLGTDKGMLFVFDSKQVSPIFWMKDMIIPIDIIWISGDKIVKIDKSVPVPKPNAKDGALPKYSPGRPIDYVLEVSSGFSDTNNIKVGDSVQMQFDLKQT